jgi:hypothetical protein
VGTLVVIGLMLYGVAVVGIGIPAAIRMGAQLSKTAGSLFGAAHAETEARGEAAPFTEDDSPD